MSQKSDLEKTAKEKLKQYFRHRTPENHKHLMKAVGEWVRSERGSA